MIEIRQLTGVCNGEEVKLPHQHVYLRGYHVAFLSRAGHVTFIEPVSDADQAAIVKHCQADTVLPTNTLEPEPETNASQQQPDT